MARERKKGDDGGGHSGTWFISYGDLVTLLMCFFIVLYAMSAVNEKKYKKLAASTKSAFNYGTGDGTGGGGGGGGGGGSGEGGSTERPKTQLEQIKEKVDSDINSRGLGAAIKTQIDDQGLVIRLSTDQVLFASGSAELTPPVVAFLGTVSGMLQGAENEVKVEGHCDNTPISAGHTYPTNWELSTARASSVVRFFVENAGLDPARMTAAGYADTKPRAPNDTPEHKSLNRRVEILIRPLPGQKATTEEKTKKKSEKDSDEEGEEAAEEKAEDKKTEEKKTDTKTEEKKTEEKKTEEKKTEDKTEDKKSSEGH